MGPKTKRGSVTDDNHDDNDALAVRLIELLNDDQVLAKLRQVLFPTELSLKIDELNLQINRMATQLEAKDAVIENLKERVNTLESEMDSAEQYSRRPNLKVYGIPETRDGGEDTDEKILAVINGRIGFEPPVQRHQLERSHRIGRRAVGPGPPGPPRAIVVRFTSERLRDDVYRVHTRLKAHNQLHRDQSIFINDDLTARRAKLAFETRLLKKARKINDCWTSYGKVIIKDLANNIKEIKSTSQLANP